MEAEFAYDDQSALSLYDCLIPKLKEQRRLIRPLDYAETVEDFMYKSKVMHYELELSKKRVPRLLQELGEKSAKIKRLEEELKIVDWYLKCMEKGIDSKQILKEYDELEKRFVNVEKTSTKKINKLEKELGEMKEKYREAMSNLKR